MMLTFITIGNLSQLFRALILNMSLLKQRSSPTDTSDFLRAFKNHISKKQETPFKFNTQQDIPEILQILLEELKSIPLLSTQFDFA